MKFILDLGFKHLFMIIAIKGMNATNPLIGTKNANPKKSCVFVINMAVLFANQDLKSFHKGSVSVLLSVPFFTNLELLMHHTYLKSILL
jgi:hypothetical protein